MTLFLKKEKITGTKVLLVSLPLVIQVTKKLKVNRRAMSYFVQQPLILTQAHQNTSQKYNTKGRHNL